MRSQFIPNNFIHFMEYPSDLLMLDWQNIRYSMTSNDWWDAVNNGNIVFKNTEQAGMTNTDRSVAEISAEWLSEWLATHKGRRIL